MPGGDRTGPNGMGPMTGRGAGFCGGWNRPGWSNRFGGWGGGDVNPSMAYDAMVRR